MMWVSIKIASPWSAVCGRLVGSKAARNASGTKIQPPMYDTFFSEDLVTEHFYDFPPLLRIQEEQLSVDSETMCT